MYNVLLLRSPAVPVRKTRIYQARRGGVVIACHSQIYPGWLALVRDSVYRDPFTNLLVFHQVILPFENLDKRGLL